MLWLQNLLKGLDVRDFWLNKIENEQFGAK